eukprot:1974813-Prymnesium_polylepis.2
MKLLRIGRLPQPQLAQLAVELADLLAHPPLGLRILQVDRVPRDGLLHLSISRCMRASTRRLALSSAAVCLRTISCRRK